jgi:hypothetical protein
MRPGSGGGNTGSGGKARRRGLRIGAEMPPRMPLKSGNDNHDLVGETPILNPCPIGMLNHPRIACSSLQPSSIAREVKWDSMTIIAMPPSSLLKQIAIFRLRSFNPSPLQPVKKVEKHHRPKHDRHDHEC